MSINIFSGGISCDDRGGVRYVNEFNFQTAGIKRFYQVENNQSCHTRAFHGHQLESKYVYCPRGSAIISAIKMGTDDAWIPSIDPSRGASAPERYVLSAAQPRILHIPAGYANGFRMLDQDTILMFFSTASLEESKDDDFRFPIDAIEPNPFNIEVR